MAEVNRVLRYEIQVDNDELYILIVAMNKALANGSIYNDVRKPQAEKLCNQLETMADMDEK